MVFSTQSRKPENLLSVVRLSGSQFAQMEEQWRGLLERSNADPLFMSWPWAYTWWETWSDQMGLELLLLGVYDDKYQLVGLAPFYFRMLKTPVGVKVKRLYILGNAWRIAPTVRSEYCGLIIDVKHEPDARRAVFGFLKNLDWDELVYCDLTNSELRSLEKSAEAEAGPAATIVRSKDPGIRLPLQASFLEWLGGLGRNTRLKVYNRRKYLQNSGDLSVSSWSDPHQIESFILKLNEFHRERWGKDAFDALASEFHIKLFDRLAANNMEAILSTLYFNGVPVSLSYDIIAGRCRYNLQSGYVQKFDSKVSLGTLHFGFVIEDAFNDDQLEYYDFLAGKGKNSFYKRHFNGQRLVFYTGQIARTSFLRKGYALQSQFPVRFRRMVNRFLNL